MGLVLFTYSSGQHRITSTVTTVFSAFSCFGLTAVSFWFASEKWIFRRHKGQKWLADVLSESRVRMHSWPGVAWCIREPQQFARKVAYWGRRRWHDLSDQCSRVLRVVKGGFGLRKVADLDTARSENGEMKSPVTPPCSPELSRFHYGETTLSPITEGAPSTVDGVDDGTVLSDSGGTMITSGSGPNSPNPNRHRLKDLVRSVIMVNRTTGAGSAFSSSVGPKRQRTMSSDAGKSGRLMDTSAMMKGSRLAVLIPKLKRMEATQEYAPHQALVRHLQFSPDGKFFATSRCVHLEQSINRIYLTYESRSWDRTSVIFRVGVSASRRARKNNSHVL